MQSRPIFVSNRSIAPLHVLGAEVRFLCEAESTGGAWSLMEVTLPENCGPPPHVHDWDEAYFVTAGTIEFTLAGERFTARRGDFVYAPGGVAHGFRGSSATTAKAIVFDAPAHAASFFKRVDREVHVLPADLPKVLAIGDATGIHFLGRDDVQSSTVAEAAAA
jgi:quercetin dioxygenase-like cupin family protein